MTLRFHLVTVSTSRAATATRVASPGDLTGAALAQRVHELGGVVAGAELVADDVATLQAIARRVAGGVDVLVFAGGTGVAPTDVTPEALAPVLDRELPGFGECMRAAGAGNPRVGVRAYLSRSFAGVLGGTLVLGLPGSPGGAVDSIDAVAPLLDHVVRLLRGQVRSCQDEVGADGEKTVDSGASSREAADR